MDRIKLDVSHEHSNHADCAVQVIFSVHATCTKIYRAKTIHMLYHNAFV